MTLLEYLYSLLRITFCPSAKVKMEHIYYYANCNLLIIIFCKGSVFTNICQIIYSYKL